ncbi:MAG: glutamate racemase [Phycisphaerae bacterium]|nr:glutamate racemase [Phycisphaerae bacterium]
MPDQRAIVVFDSGVGGLTVARAIRRRLPAESLVYFGDTARVPYGIRSSPTITRFACEIVRFLVKFQPKALVIACNTVSAVALDALREQFDLPIWDVIEPGARLAAIHSWRGPIGLLATTATVASDAYPRAIRRHNPGARVVAQPAPLLVPLVEEGWPADHPIVRLAIDEYLKPVLEKTRGTGTPPVGMLLGCTHYPLLADTIRAALGEGVELIDSAEQTANVLADELPKLGLEAAPQPGTRGSLTCLVTDNADRFAEVGSRFLGEPIERVTYIGPDEFFAAQQGAGA